VTGVTGLGSGITADAQTGIRDGQDSAPLGGTTGDELPGDCRAGL
jgi:hypothetical protein